MATASGAAIRTEARIGGTNAPDERPASLSRTFGKRTSCHPHALQNRLEDIFQHGFHRTGVIFQIGERHFRLQHQNSAGGGWCWNFSRAEGRPKSIDFGQRTGIRFTVELAGDGQE